MTTRVRTLNFLPAIFQTPTNAQFLGATLDQLTAQPNTVKIEGYIGSKFGYGINASNHYIPEPTKTRQDYQLEPGVVFTKTNDATAQDFITYPGLIDALKIEGAVTGNNNRLFNSDFYSWDSFTNLDKLINFNQYYWLPQGPSEVTVSSDPIYNFIDYTVADKVNGYSIYPTGTPDTSINPTITLLRGGIYTFAVDQTSQFWIQGEPGITGYSQAQPNIYTRDVYGVTDNGSSIGTVTFNVPYKDAQAEYNFPGNNIVSVVSTIPLSQLNGALLSEIGSIDGITSLNGLTVLFYNTDELSSYNNFYTISYTGSTLDPTLVLTAGPEIPTNEKITPVYGTEWGNRPFYKDISGFIVVIPYLSAAMDTLYYQDGTASNNVGIIRLVESNTSNAIDVETDILNKQTFTSSNGVVFTNGLKVIFQGDIIPSSYKTGEYYVEGVGIAIQLIPTETLVTPEEFTLTTFIPWDTTAFDVDGWESIPNVPVIPDYITIARNSIDRNAWSRSNRWFHIDVINATATYNNNPNLLSLYATKENKAKRPIIEFYPNLKLFNSGTEGKHSADFIDIRTTDALSYVSGQENYYPDVVVYTAYTATINGVSSQTTTTIEILASDITGSFSIGQYTTDSTNILPRNTMITDVSSVDEYGYITLTVEWEFSTSFSTTTDSSMIATDTTVDNYALYDGATIIFAADTDENIKNKIYMARLSTLENSSIPLLTLTETKDGTALVNQQVTIMRGYANHGKNFYFDGIDWIEAQEKTRINQPPLFDIFDSNNISFGDPTIYDGTSFAGNKLFAYGIGSGTNDAVMGFPLRYSSINNIGDISFDVSLNADTFDYVLGSNPITQKINTGYVYKYNTRTAYERALGWQTAISPSIQYQLFDFVYYSTNPTLVFTCDIAKADNSSTNWPTIQVYINNTIQNTNKYIVTTTENSTTVTLNENSLLGIEETTIQILLLSDQVSEIGYYIIPTNLNNNPFNADITVANIGDIRGQYQSIFYNNPNTLGTIFGANNFRDLGNLVPYGTRIIQNSASLVLPSIFLRKQNHNLFNSLLFNNREYINFKNSLIGTVNNSDYVQQFNPSTILDDALDQLTASKTNNLPFFWSDMIPSKAPYITNTYMFANSLDISIYPLIQTYDYSKANYNGILVYLTRTVDRLTTTTQLIKGVDYTVSVDSPSLTVTKDLLPGDKIVIKEYNQTYGSYIPNTPTKLGLYPAYIPGVVLDSEYSTPTYFIRGHDGSYNKLYGNYDPITNVLIDFRDQVLLEYELRVYNNLKIGSAIPIREHDVLPGFFRTTEYSYNEILQIYNTTFLNWIGQNRIDYKNQLYNKGNQFTYNYYQSGNKIDKAVIEQGYWRGIYLYFYDTSTPNITPWEMLGLQDQPNWWITRYGPAPYTRDNLILWEDLAAGINWNNGDPYIVPSAIRPELLTIIPVDSTGTLLNPFDAIVGNYNDNLFQRNWKVGDCGPAEFSYRRSSSWPFDLMRIFALTNPTQFFNLGVDLDNYKYNEEFNQYLVNDRTHLIISDIEIYGSGIAKTSYINWIIDFEKQAGINATQNITDLLNNLDVRLIYRLAGFSDKTLLKFYVDKGTPNSRNASLLIPDESYSVLLYDNQPINKLVYSGVVVQLTDNGYVVYGNSQEAAYFKTLRHKQNGNTNTITIEKLTVKVPKDFYLTEVIVPYGTIFYSIQEVATFMACYGAYLEEQGMKFQQIQFGLEINWNQMISEFLYWSQTGWEVGGIITVNPAATQLEINKDGCVVQPLTLRQTNFVLNQNLYPIQSIDLSIVRDSSDFIIKPLNQGDTIAYSQFNISNIEHGIVFSNITLFNDILYNLITGLRQNRIAVRGTKTADWNGTIDVAGFILNQDNIEEWNGNIKYTKGAIVKYKNRYWTSLRINQASTVFEEKYWKQTEYDQIQKGLLPNPSTRAYESILYYDVNRANLEQDADLLSFSLIGYRPRDYLALADLTDITQINVYKNLIKNKGTLNAASVFKGANLPQGGIDYDIYENWAIKSGEFGGVLNNNFIEFRINQAYMTGNPSIVALTNGIYTPGAQQEVPIYSLFNYGRPISDVNILAQVSPTTPSMLLPTAGYVNFNDVKMFAYFYPQLNTAINSRGSLVSIRDFYVRDYTWLANFLEDWQVFTPISLGQVINARNNLNGTTTITFAEPHNLTQKQPFAIVNFANNIDGYYTVSTVVDSYKVLITLALDPNTRNITGQGIGLRFQSQRVSTPADIITLPLLDAEFIKNRVWVDSNVDGAWAVYEKGINFQYESEINEPSTNTFGSAVAYSPNLGYLVGDADAGKVYRYAYDLQRAEFKLKQTITQGTSFGKTIAHAGNIFVISESLYAIYVYELQQTTLVDELVLLQAAITEPFGSSNWGESLAISGDTNWLYVSDCTNVANPNKVYVYRKSQLTGEYTFIDTITTAGLTVGDRFGHSIATNYYGDTIVISAPNKNYDSNITDWGYTYVFNRTVQNIEAQYSTTSDTALTAAMAWTQPTRTSTVTDTTAGSNTITCGTTAYFLVDNPVIFSGKIYAGSDIEPNTVYYIHSIPAPGTIKIKTTRAGTDPLTLGTTSDTGMFINVQYIELFISVNGTLVDDSNYAVIGNDFVYTGPLLAGDIINISGQNFTLLQTLTTENTPKLNVNFGMSVSTTTHGSEILVGAPFELTTQLNEGAVYRYTSGGGKYGIIIGTSDVNITAPRRLLINGYQVYLPTGDATEAATAINNARITNIEASASDGKLIISLINSTLYVPEEKIVLSAVETDTLLELGIDIYTQTQTITCPHASSRTQFGSVVKFNESNSFVVSAPAGTRYEATTFDFTDDENLDNDTVFDNNATQWIDTCPNAGAAYMFDYLAIYNETLATPGKFVYAQSINAQNINYGAQPYYGQAIDFNNQHVIIGTPNFIPNDINGQAITYVNSIGTKDWEVYRSSCEIVDINKIQNAQLFSADTNNTLINLDYIDPLQGKILGAARENIDIVSNIDPAYYNNVSDTAKSGLVWGLNHFGQIWFDTSNVRLVNYHQNDVVYNSQYWGTLFPGSDVAIYTWISSNVLPIDYPGPGTPYNINSYAIQYTLNSVGSLIPVYFYWVKNTNIIFEQQGKTLADSIIASYIRSPKNSGISYFAPLLPNAFGLYNSGEYINATDTVLHIGFSIGTNDDVTHNQFDLIRANYADDFLPGLPLLGENISPDSLYDRLLDSMCGVDESGAIVPNPYLPKPVQYGILARPRQSFFINRFAALKNYLTYANSVLAQYPIAEVRQYSFLFAEGATNPSTTNGEPFFDTSWYWEYINWWAIGYSDNTKATMQVALYADLATLSVAPGTIINVAANSSGKAETYIYELDGTWTRIGLERGTIKFKSALWDYAATRLGFGDNFYDTTPFDVYPSEETRYIIRSLNEQIYTNDLLIHRNRSLILLFEYIQSETIETQNYLPWLNKTSFIDVSHTIRELSPIKVYQSDNQDFLAGYLNEIKPYHVVIKEFLFKYTKTDLYAGDITDFDLPAKYNEATEQFITPQLVYRNPNSSNKFLPTDAIWTDSAYTDWYNNYGVSIVGQTNVKITVLASYIALNSTEMVVDNVSGFPINGIVKIDEEYIGYSSVDRSLNIVYGLSRGVNGSLITTHIPGELIYIDLPAALVLTGGREYTEPPRIEAYIDTSIYPTPTKSAILQVNMSLDTVLSITVIDPGQGYAILPEIQIAPAITITFSSANVRAGTYNIIQAYAPKLQTGDEVQYIVGEDTTAIGGLKNKQWYFINILETVPTTAIALYTTYRDAVRGVNRIVLLDVGTGDNHTLNLGARASCISAANPIRENNIVLRFDRTTYKSELLDWTASSFYGSFYAGSYSNSEQVASSSILLDSTQPPIDSILTSPQGVILPIIDLRNEQTINYSSFIRYVASTNTVDNSIRLIPGDDGAGNPNASGSTIGFYVDMPIKFKGAVVGGLVNDVEYYVLSILNEVDFTVSDTVGGSVVLLTTASVGTAELKCYIGEVKNQAIITVNYPGITQITATSAGTNKLTIPLTVLGTGGTKGFYMNLPIFFTGDMFGGVVENQIYYITTVSDDETFTMSENPNPMILNVTETNAGTDTITIDTTTDNLRLNEALIFTDMFITGTPVTNFGNIIKGTTYYIINIVNNNEIQISSRINGDVFALSTVTADPDTSAMLVNQKDTATLSTGPVVGYTGSMTINISLPVSPGQVDGQQFTFYETSGQYLALTGTTSNLITRIIGSTIATSNRIALKYAGAETNLYVNLPVQVAGNIGGLIAGTQYYIIEIGDTIVQVTDTAPSGITCDDTTLLYVDMSIVFSGAGIGGVEISVEYYVESIIDGTHFTITTSPGGSPLALTTASGSMTGLGETYIQVSTGVGGAPVTLSTVAGPINLIQTITGADPSFDVSYKLGGYRVIIEEPSEGYAVDNIITISGTDLGGSSPANDLVMTVASIGSLGELIHVICSGTVAGNTRKYYLKVISTTEFEVYDNALMTIPTNGLTLPFVAATITTITSVTSSGNLITGLDTSGFNVDDSIVFTGNVFGNLILGTTYYIITSGATDITISETPGGAVFNPGDATGSCTAAKAGDYALLPEPFYFNQSIVKYLNRVYRCIISNNDREFIFGKWELLISENHRLNALDRIMGYYQPTDNMPGLDLTQLVDGITYPNGTYLGNAFAPDDQFVIDTLLQDRPFYPTGLDVKAITWNGTNYLGAMNAVTYSGVIDSINGENWTIASIARSPINVTDIIYAGGLYVITTTNPATPILRSNDGITWTSNGQYTPYDSTPYDTLPYDITALSVASLSLNSVGYLNGLYVAVGQNITASTDTYTWTQQYSFPDDLTNQLYGITAINIPAYIGFVAVGKGQALDYSSGITNRIDINLIINSVDGISWAQTTPITSKGLYSITGSNALAVTVGEDGIIYVSENCSDWLGINETTVVNVDSSASVINVNNTVGFAINDAVRFSTSFNNISNAVTYYIVDIISTSKIQVSLTLGGSPIALTTEDPITTVYMNIYPSTATLRDVLYANSVFVTVGDGGLIKTSSDGYSWTTQTSGTIQNLYGIIYNNDDDVWVAVGGNNTIILSDDNGITWNSSSVFTVDPSTYDIVGSEFLSGYGPEELIPGVIKDNLMLTVATRPGTNWTSTEYAHVGYNVVSIELTPESGTQVDYSFYGAARTPSALTVAIISGVTGLSTTIYEPDYSVDWIHGIVTLAEPLPYVPIIDKLRIDVYETGNGNQLVKANTNTDPIRTNSVTGWNEIEVNCNYSATLFSGGGIIKPNTNPMQVHAFETTALTNAIYCDAITDFVLNGPITFQGATFGGILEDTTYYVKTISPITKTITVSVTFASGSAGPTLALTDAVGSMYAITQLGYGQTWTAPLIYHNGTKLIQGEINTLTRTNGVTNTITTNTTSGLIVDTPIVFSDTIFGGIIQPRTVYYVKSIFDTNEFTISATVGGPTLALTTSTGGAQFITNDYAFGVGNNGISAKIIFIGNVDSGITTPYDPVTDYLSYTLFGETTPEQYGYTIPETQLFVGTGSASSFTITNYLTPDSIDNAIVEINGVRQTQSAYSIDIGTGEILFITPPPLDATVAVTTYNLTDRQYLNTQFGITGTPGGAYVVLTVGSTTHSEIPFDALITAGSFVIGQTYTIVSTGGGSTDFTLIGAANNIIGTTFVATGIGTGTGTASVGFDESDFSEDLNWLTLSVGSTTSLVINQEIRFTAPTLGGLLAETAYYVLEILSATEFTISNVLGGSPTVVTTDFGSMSTTTNSITVANITYINNGLVSPLATVNVTTATAATDKFTSTSTAGFVVDQTILFKAAIIDATTMTTGKEYRIETVGGTPTNWVAIGAASATVGTIFTYNGVAVTGTGTALLASFGGVSTLGIVYFIRSITAPNDGTFTIKDESGNQVMLTDDTGLVVAVVGGIPAVRVTTGIPHTLTENMLVRIDGVVGSVQLNNNIYYAKIITSTVVDLYTETYSPAYGVENYPVTTITTYVSGGWIWKDGLFTIITALGTNTTSGTNIITANSTTALIVDTPVIFTEIGKTIGDTTFGGLIIGTEYYIRQVLSPTEFTISEVRSGTIKSLTDSAISATSMVLNSVYRITTVGGVPTNWVAVGASDANVGTIFTYNGVAVTGNGTVDLASNILNISQWEQTNVDRLWVTINGYRVPSSKLRLNPANDVSIAATIVPGDEVIITSMMPSATPNEEVYLLSVDATEISIVHRANTQTRTWLTRELKNTDDFIYINDVTRVTDILSQEVTAPAAVDNVVSIGLIGDKRIITAVTVYNNSTNSLVDPQYYEIIIEDLAPILKIASGYWISTGDSLSITITEGNLVYINGEQIRFATLDPINNTLTDLQRGVNGTGIQDIIPLYTDVFSIISTNQLADARYFETWNSNIYNVIAGDPLQISDTAAALFLNNDIT